jgi:hypothetical protein
MAIVKDVFVSGTIGNLIFYHRMGKNCVRVKRTHLKQTAATKVRGINFGIASRACKGLRSRLKAAMPLPKDRSFQGRFCGAIAKWIGQSAIDELLPTDKVPFVSTFPFTKEQPFGERCKAPLTISQQDDVVTVHIGTFIPTVQISAPAGTSLIMLIISVAGCLLKTGEPLSNETHTIELPYDNIPISAQVLEFHVATPAGSLTVTAARLIYKKFQYNAWEDMNNKAFLPAGVIDAMYNKRRGDNILLMSCLFICATVLN